MADKDRAVTCDGVGDHLLHDRSRSAAVATVQQIAPPVQKPVACERRAERPEALHLLEHRIRGTSREAQERVHLDIASLEDDVVDRVALDAVLRRPGRDDATLEALALAGIIGERPVGI